MRKTIPLALLFAFALTASPAWACPYCESDIGKEVAAGIFNEDFAFNALLTLSPVPILLLIVYVMYFGMPFPKRPSKQRPADRSNSPTASESPLGAEHD